VEAVAAAATMRCCADAWQEDNMPDARRKLAAPCGLYCGNCTNLLLDGACHGCGCSCGLCAAEAHRTSCPVFHCCAEERGLASCAECLDFPCTAIIQFAYDPIWRTHLPVLENLRRIRRVGVDGWLDEQEAYWANERRLERWIQLHLQCKTRHRQAGSKSRARREPGG
jgi:hypothetical protein